MPTRLSASGPLLEVGERVGQRLGIGLGAADLQRDRVGVVGHVDARIIRGVGFRHLLGAVAQAHDPGRLAEDLRLGQRKEVALVAAVERAGDVARQLQMLLLVLADRDVRRLVERGCRPPSAPGRRRGRARPLSRCLPAFSLNCVIRLSQPSGVRQPSSQASSAWALTMLWLKMMQRSGSMPAAI